MWPLFHLPASSSSQFSDSPAAITPRLKAGQQPRARKEVVLGEMTQHYTNMKDYIVFISV